ncbi:MAG TPA: hypothetical protein VFT82_00870 [Candidatus Paceibacterota bacterium]|nr:hypothetical protein [Candidatus Paceibacterota bacterium]
MNEETPHARFRLTRPMKLGVLWALFALASFGTYALSHQIKFRFENEAAAFLSTGSSHEIDLYAGKADPTEIDIRRGDQVVFVVKDSSRHDITEERTDRRDARLESGEIRKDESYTLVFTQSGTYSFYDRLDQDIRVTVRIR